MTVLLALLVAQLSGGPAGMACGNGRLDRTRQQVCPSCVPGGACACTELEVAEECDGALVPKTCADLGWAGGTLRCDSRCALDSSGCAATDPALTSKTVALAPGTEKARVVAGERGNVGLIEVSRRELVVSRVWPPSLTVDRRGSAQVQPNESGADGFADAAAFPSRDGWVVIAEQYPGFLSTWVVPERGNLRGPTERIWMGAQTPVFGEAGLAGLSSREGLFFTTVGIEGITGQHPPQRAFEKGTRLSGAVSAIASGRDVLVAAVTATTGGVGSIAIVSVNPRGEVASTDRIETAARGLAWARGAELPWLVWSDAEGLFAAPFDATGKRAGKEIRVGNAKGAISAAEIRGKRIEAILGGHLVSSTLDGREAADLVTLAAQGLEIASATFGEGYAWFVWRAAGPKPSPLSLTQVKR